MSVVETDLVPFLFIDDQSAELLRTCQDSDTSTDIVSVAAEAEIDIVSDPIIVTADSAAISFFNFIIENPPIS